MMDSKMMFALVAGLFAAPLAAQELVDREPLGIELGLTLKEVPLYVAAPFQQEVVEAEDAQREQNGELPMYGRVQPIDIDLRSGGRWSLLPNGDHLWRATVTSPGALAVELFFEEMDLPPGAMLHVYAPDAQQVEGGYGPEHAGPEGVFSSEQVYGDRCIVEYYEPDAVSGEGRFRITGVGHAYRSVGSAKAQDCQVDIVCSPEGDGWQEESDGVVRIRVKEGSSLGWCSGSLVNNTASDCRPFILTALHCGVNSSTADFQQWKFYFRYQRTGCDIGWASASKVLTGCMRRADSNDGGGMSGSDFLLVETEDPVPPSFQPYWNGWDATGAGSSSGVSIHHPAGDEKKISTYTSNLITSSWGSAGTHWRVVWSATPNGHGVTEGGSSGSPIFNADARIIGTLTGGGSYCNSVVPGGQNQPDYYGKMDKHWTANPNPANEKLKVWLDPGNTGNNVWDGTYAPCGNVGVADRDERPAPAVFPNPVSDLLTVEYPDGLLRVERIDLLDVSGRLVWTERPVGTGRAFVDVRALQSGTYLVRVTAGGVEYAATRVTVTHDH